MKEPETRGRFKEVAFEKLALAFGVTVVIMILWIGQRLVAGSTTTLSRYGLGFLTTSTWDVPHAIYGALPFLYGTAVSSFLALLIAVPLGVGTALFLSEVAPARLATPVSFVVELLAAVPSIIYGLWGFTVLCPFLHAHVTPWLERNLGANPLFAGPSVLTNVFAAAVILAIMVLPTITAISREVLRSVHPSQRGASLGLGATRWEAIWQVVLPEARAGITGAVVLGLGRALGETMAVVMVIGNTPQIKASVLQPGYTMPGLLANQFNEAYNDVLQRSALLEVALILFVVTVLVNGAARLLVRSAQRRAFRSGPRDAQPASGLMKAVRALPRFGWGSALLLLAAVQVYFDLRVHGVRALGLPVEIALFVALVGSVLFRWFRKAASGDRLRAFVSGAMQGLLSLAAGVACFALGALLYYVFQRGIHGLSPALFTQLPRPPGMAGGGLKNALVGTLMLTAIASAIAIPVGVLAGIYVSQFGRGKLRDAIRFSADVLNGVPSVVVGLFAYAAFVLPFGHFSAWAGGAALAFLMVPIVLRTTEEIVRLVPEHYLQGALSMGSSRAYAVLTVVLPPARNGILTGVMLAVARAMGETAPLLFTAFGSEQLVTNPSEPVSSLTMKIYQYAVSPYDDWVSQAWAAALVLLAFVLLLSVAARLSASRLVRAR